MSSQDSYTILSIGCGTGIFEQPFLENLLAGNKQIHFVGVDPNEKECTITREWCEKISNSKPTSFDFKIYPVCFENFQSQQSFDLILAIHSFYNISDIETSIKKIYRLIKEGGMAIIAIEKKRQLLNEPVYYVYRRLYEKISYYGEDIQEVLTGFNFSFYSEIINCSVKITECFRKGYKLGKLLLDFILLANTAYFSESQLRLLLDYFGAGSQKTENGEILLPFLTNLFYIEKY